MTKLEDAIALIAAAQRRRDAALAPLETELKLRREQGLSIVLDDFFARFPEVRTIYWTQGVPSFNNGEPCVFGIGEVRFSPVDHRDIHSPFFEDSVNDAAAPEQHEDRRAFDRFGRRGTPELHAAMEAVDHAFREVLEAHLEETFGNAFVRAHAGGFEVAYHDF